MMDSQEATIVIGADGPESLIGRRIAVSMNCQRCGYDLRGLDAMGDCPECGIRIRKSILARIDPEVHTLPSIARQYMVSLGLRLFAGFMIGSFSLWIISSLLTQSLVEWGRENANRSIEHLIQIGLYSGYLAILAALMSLAGLFMMRSLLTSEFPSKSLRILIQLAIGVLFWIAAIVLQLSGQPGDGLGPVARAFTAIGSRGTGLLPELFVSMSPMIGGWIILFGVRSFFGEMGRRSRQFRTATTNRQKILDIIWASMFWCTGAILQWIGAGRGSSMLVTFGTVLRVISGVLVLIGLIYLVMNLLWIARALNAPPPRLRTLLTDPPDLPQEV